MNNIDEQRDLGRDSLKFSTWTMCFLDSSDKQTFGNLTQSALKAYQLDPKEQYFSAAVIGSENYKKLKKIASYYADQKGYSLGNLIDIAYEKMLNSNSCDWWDRLVKLFGYEQKEDDPEDGMIFWRQK